MPKSPQPTPDEVAAAAGIEVHELPVHVLRPTHFPELGVNAMIALEQVDGRFGLVSVYFTEPVTDWAALVGVDWAAAANFALKVESVYAATDGTLGAFMGAHHRPEVVDLVRRHRVGVETLRDAVEAYEQAGTIEKAAETLHVSTRTMTRYLARARKEGLL